MNIQAADFKDRVLRLLDSQRRVLERIATGAPLADVLGTLVTLIEEQADHLRCAVLLVDAAETRLRLAAASKPVLDMQPALEPFLRLGQSAGPCVTAAYRKEPVYARDIAGDALWSNVRELAAQFGFRAVWSTPIVGDDNRVLGVFAMYCAEPRLPNPSCVQLIEMAVQLARVAIEAKADDDLLRTTFDDALTPLFVSDMDHRIVRANRAFAAVLGYAPADLRGRPVAEISEGVEPAALLREVLARDHVVSDRRYRRRNGRMLWTRERSSVRLDERRAPRYVATRVDHFSDADPLAHLSRREREVLQQVVAGNTSKQIAAQLCISPSSVDTYRSRLMFKLGVEDLPGLVRFAIRHRIVAA